MEDYIHLSLVLMKHFLRQIAGIGTGNEWIKLHLLNNWVQNNGYEVGVFPLLKEVDYKELPEFTLKQATERVKAWPLSQEEEDNFAQLINDAKEEKEAEYKRKKFCRDRSERRFFHLMMHNMEAGHHPPHLEMMQEAMAIDAGLAGPAGEQGGGGFDLQGPGFLLQGIQLNPNLLQQPQDQDHQHLLVEHPDFLQLPPGVFPIDDIDPDSDEELLALL